MTRLVFLIIVAVCVGVFSVVWYTHRSNVRSVNSGAVQEQPADDSKTDTVASQTQQAQQTPASGQAGPDQHPPDQAVQVPAKGAHPEQIDGALAAPPPADTTPRNPANGMIFAGRGKYQVYRQGDITWRLNTDTGQACILFATDAEWSQPRVYQQGCGAK